MKTEPKRDIFCKSDNKMNYNLIEKKINTNNLLLS